MLGRVGQRLGGDLVGGDLDRIRNFCFDRDITGHPDRRAARQCLECSAQPAAGQDGRMDVSPQNWRISRPRTPPASNSR